MPLYNKQYNLVPVKRRWCSAVWKVTAGLAESKESLPIGIQLQSPDTDCLETETNSAFIEYGSIFSFAIANEVG